MAVINCPGCNKKISDKASNCSHCGLELKGLDPEKISRLSNTKKIEKAQRLMNYSFLSMLLFCGGFLFMFWDNVEKGSWQHTTAMVSSVIGFILYIAIRVRMLIFKFQHKKRS
jgi:hypothetical protein